ncbi:uncharacterized protein LOC144099876 [Amblyomma americanum]
MHSASLKTATNSPLVGAAFASPCRPSSPCWRGTAERSLDSCLETSGRNVDSAKLAPGRPPVSELQQSHVASVRCYVSEHGEHGEQGGGDGHCQRDPRQRPPRLDARVSARPGRAVSRPCIHHHMALTTTAYPPSPQDALTSERGEGPLSWASRLYTSVGSGIVCSAHRLCCHHHQGSGRAPTGRTGRKAHTGHGTR